MIYNFCIAIVPPRRTVKGEGYGGEGYGEG